MSWISNVWKVRPAKRRDATRPHEVQTHSPQKKFTQIADRNAPWVRANLLVVFREAVQVLAGADVDSSVGDGRRGCGHLVEFVGGHDV